MASIGMHSGPVFRPGLAADADPAHGCAVPMEIAKLRRRTSAQAMKGAVERSGDAVLAEALEQCFAAGASEPIDDLTHGFHTYPGRMHPGVAAALVARFAGRGAALLDPFCGGGTVLVEAIRGGSPAVGVDLNPLALRISEVRTAHMDSSARERFRGRAAKVVEKSLLSVQKRASCIAPIPRAEVTWYESHVLRELAGLWAAIEALEHREDRRALELVFSSLVVKFSKQKADTSLFRVEKRIRKGLATEFFGRKCTELEKRWADLDDVWPPDLATPSLSLGDARQLGRVLGPRRFDCVITSPPYGGTYDYAAHHARRMAWLGVGATPLERGEVGSRRRGQWDDSADQWDLELAAVLSSIGQVMRRDGVVVFVIGDGFLAGRIISADAQIRRLAPAAGFCVRAIASQARGSRGQDPDRREHLILMVPETTGVCRQPQPRIWSAGARRGRRG